MIDKQDIAFIVIGDVHGRNFWKDAIGFEQDVPVIFLGDYLDPYPNEGITTDMALDNFREVLDYAKSNKNVNLLYGNHDSYAFHDAGLCSCRHDFVRYDEICKIFDDNKELFKFAHEETVGGKRFLMTHAGIHPQWLDENRDIFGDDFQWTADEINSCHGKEGFMDALKTYSWRRGGYRDYGSMVWCDVRDHFAVSGYDKMPVDVVQVFGHTQFVKAFGFKTYCQFYNVDCRKVVVVDKTGALRYLNDGSPVEVDYGDDDNNSEN